MIQGRNSYTLCQIHMTTNADRTDDRAVNTNAGMVAYQDIAHRIINATIRFNHASLT